MVNIALETTLLELFVFFGGCFLLRSRGLLSSLFFLPSSSICFDTNTIAFSINDRDEIVGEFTNAAGVNHAFIRQRGIFTQFDPPGATSSVAFGINFLGIIVGSFTDAENAGHGFFDVAGHFTQVNFPGAASTDADGINLEGVIVGDFFDGANVEHGFIAVH